MMRRQAAVLLTRIVLLCACAVASTAHAADAISKMRAGYARQAKALKKMSNAELVMLRGGVSHQTRFFMSSLIESEFQRRLALGMK